MRRSIEIMERATSLDEMSAAVDELQAATGAAGEEVRVRAVTAGPQVHTPAANTSPLTTQTHSQAALSRDAWLTLVPLLAPNWAPSGDGAQAAAAAHRGVSAWRWRLGLCRVVLVESNPAKERHARQVIGACIAHTICLCFLALLWP